MARKLVYSNVAVSITDSFVGREKWTSVCEEWVVEREQLASAHEE